MSIAAPHSPFALRALAWTERWNLVLAALVMAFLGTTTHNALAQAQRVWGADISYWDCPDGYELSPANWSTAYSSSGGNRVFVQLRASRGGTNGIDRTAGYPGNGTNQTLQRRYDDPRFFQNLKRAVAAGMQVGSYHRGQQVSTTPGAAEAAHMLQTAGPWMRPGYTVPMLDWEDGGFNATQAQWAIDFSDKIFEVMQIRPCVYIGGANSKALQDDLSMTQALKDALAKPAALMPSVTGVRFYMLWNPRYTNYVDWATMNPKDTYSGFYGPWDDYGDSQPWSFWQYLSSVSIPGFNVYRSNHDGDICHGDLEYLRNYLVPAVWWNDNNGDWSTTNNWNCGQVPVDPTPDPALGMPTPYESPELPGTRVPGDLGGSGPTSPEYDTVILERPTSITVTHSSGTHNIRKLYMRETLNITGGSLTINYNPAYRPDDTPTCLHAGPISAQFTGPVTLSGSGALNVNTLQVDATRTFSVNGGSLAFTAISLMPGTTPATLSIGGNATYGAYPGTSATIANGTGSGSSGRIDLSGGTRTFNVNGGVNLYAQVPISGGGLIKSGAGSLHLDCSNSYAAGTTINAGTLEAGVAGALPGNVTNTAGVLKLDSNTAMAPGATLVLAGSPAAGAVNLAFTGTPQTINALYFGGVRQAAGTWGAAGAAHIHPAFTGPGTLNVTTGPTPSSINVTRTAGTSPDTYGDTVTFTATVTGSSPTGTVQFKVNGVSVGSPVTLVSGSVAFTTNSLPVSGSPYQITAFYSGDGNNTASDNSASPLAQSITARPTACALTSSANPAGPGTNVTFTATVAGVPPAAAQPTGNVVFSANGTPFATQALVSGSASASTASLPLGTNAITAEYAGNGNFLSSTANLAQAVRLFSTCSQTNALLSVTNHHDGSFTLTFLGTPQAQYYLLASPSVAAPMFTWTPVAGSTNTVTNTSGVWQFTVTNTAAQQFYRSTAVESCQ